MNRFASSCRTLSQRGFYPLQGAVAVARSRRASLHPSQSWTGCGAMSRGAASQAYPAHTVVAMPALSPTMASGTIGKWVVKEGDLVGPGDVIAEVETDKASVPFESQEDFVIAKLLAQEGEEISVGKPVMVTVEEGADISLFKDFQPPDDKDAGSPKPEAKKEAEVAPQKKLEPKPEPTREAPKPPVASAPTKRNDAKTEDAKPQPPKSAAPQPATTAENGIVGVRWGQGVAKTALAKKLAADQKSYREKYGRSGQKVLTSQ